jgi:hypothetical protein
VSNETRIPNHKETTMKRNRYLVPAGLLIFFALCLVPVGQAQQLTPVTQAPGEPWQLGLKGTFSSTSTPTGAFNTGGILYWKLVFAPSGTVSSCTFSLDSSSVGTSFTTGGILSSATIGSCASPGSYVTSAAVTPANFGQITPTITGTGSVTVYLYGYTENPALSSGASSNVTVTNFPGTQPVSGSVTATQATGSNLHTAVDSLPALGTGSNTIGNVNQTIGTAGFGKVTDGSNTAAVKPASTAVAATDPSLAVGLSPNSPLPAGASTIGNVNQTIGTAGFGKVTDGTNTAAVKAASTAPAATDPAIVVAVSPNTPTLPVSGTGNFNTQPAGFSSALAGQQAVTATATALPSNSVHGFCISALSTNTISVFVGPSGVTTGTGYELVPGESVCPQLSNTNTVFVIASTTGASISWLGL